MNRSFLVLLLWVALSLPASAQTPDPDPGAPGTAPAEPTPEAAPGTPPAPQTQALPEAPVPPQAPMGPTGDEPGLDDLLSTKAAEVTEGWQGPAVAERREYPWIEHHGYMRLRVQGTWRAHLGTNAVYVGGGTSVNTSAFGAPIVYNAANAALKKTEDWIGGANIRLRYAPTVHVADGLMIRTEIDLLDNLTLGSTPDWDPNRPDAVLPLFARGQAAPRLGNFSLRESVTVKQAYMVWTPVNPTDAKSFLLQFSAGRMARHWGLGMLENGGEDLDADSGTYLDRVTLLTRLWGVYVELGYNWASTGPTSTDATQNFGEPHDLTNSDNVSDVSVAIFQKPMTDAERRARFDRLSVQNKPVLDWGAYLTYRRQTLDLVQAAPGATTTTNADGSLTTERRAAWTLTPDVWLRLQWKPSHKENVRIELEASGVFGHIDNVPRYEYLDGTPPSYRRVGDAGDEFPMDIQAWGLALEAEYSYGAISGGLSLGAASGSDVPYFGWADRNNFNIVRDGNYVSTLRSFYFHPDYKIDQLLFRHVIGTVTDAFYVKPWIQYDLFDGQKSSLAGRLDVIYGRAIEAAATPGGDPNLGVELDVKLFYEEKGVFFVGMEWGTLWPLAGFALKPDYGCPEGTGQCLNLPLDTEDPLGGKKTVSPRWAMSVKGRFGVMF